MANNLEQLTQRYLNEPAFREKMKRDLEGTVRSCGITLSQEEWKIVRNLITSTSDEALHARVSKGGLRS